MNTYRPFSSCRKEVRVSTCRLPIIKHNKQKISTVIIFIVFIILPQKSIWFILIKIKKMRCEKKPTKKDITTLSLMRHFYNEYSKKANKKKEQVYLISQQGKPTRLKTDSACKLSQFIEKQSQYKRRLSTQCQTTKYRTIQPQSPSLDEKINKRCFFKSIYSKEHPLLKSSHVIKEKEEVKFEMQKLDFPRLNSLTDANKIVTPSKRRIELIEVKQKIDTMKKIKVERMKRLRYNYLVTHCFRSKNLPKSDCSDRRKNYTNDSLQKTKERIFPSNQVFG